MTVLIADFEMAFCGALLGWKQIILLMFSFFLFLFYCAIQGKSISWVVNSSLNRTWKPLSYSSLGDIGFRVQFNREFPRQAMNFPTKLIEGSLNGEYFNIHLVFYNLLQLVVK